MKKGWHTGCYIIGPRNMGKKYATIERLKRDLIKPPEGVDVNLDIAPDRVNYAYILVHGKNNVFKIPVHVDYYLNGEYRQCVMENYYGALEACANGR